MTPAGTGAVGLVRGSDVGAQRRYHEYGRLLLLAVVPAGLDPLRPLGGLDDDEGPPGGEVEVQHANGDILCNSESKEEGVKGGEYSDIKDHMVAQGS